MDKETRDWIYAARHEALSYSSGRRTESGRADLAMAFNQSRRAIRRDLAMIDDVAPRTVGSLSERLSDSVDQ
jgi:transcriptional antiterminator